MATQRVGPKPKPLIRSPSQARLSFRHRAQSIISSNALDELELEVSTGLRCEPSDVESGSKYTVIAAEALFSCVWWAILQEFLSSVMQIQIQYKSFNCLLFGLVWLSSLVLNSWNAIPLSRHALLLVRMLSLAGVLHQSAPCSFTSLLVLAFGNFFAVQGLVGSWWNTSGLDQFRKVYCHLLGYFILLSIKTFGISTLPRNPQEQIVCLLVTGFALLHVWWSEKRTPLINQKMNASVRHLIPGVVPTGIAFGSLLFLTHALLIRLSQVSALSNWNLSEPYQSLCLLLLCLFTLIVMSDEDNYVGHFAWSSVACVACVVFCVFPLMPGYLGGIVLVLYVVSTWPLLCSRLCLHPAHVFTLGLVVYFSLGFFYLVLLSSGPNVWLLLPSVLALAVGSRRWGLSNEPRTNLSHHHTFFLGRVMGKLPSPGGPAKAPFCSLFDGEDMDRDSMRQQATLEMLQAEDQEYHFFFKKITLCAIVLFAVSVVSTGVLHLNAYGSADRAV